MSKVSDMAMDQQQEGVDELLCEIDHWKERAVEAERLLAWAIPLLTVIFEQHDFAAAMKKLNIIPGPEYNEARDFLEGRP